MVCLALVTGIVSAVDAKGAVINLAGGVEGVLKASEMGRETLNVNDSVESKIINVDRKNRVISLSIKAKDTEEEQETLREFNRSGEESTGTTIGDLLKEKMENRDSN